MTGNDTLTAERGIFSLDAYRGLVQGLLDRGYCLTDYHDVKPGLANLVLRHDVDFDLGSAVALAELESDRGWTASYFVLVRTELYNPFSARGERHIRRLVELGHRVGLHFDASAYPDSVDRLRAGIVMECGILANVVGGPIDRFSLHRPQPSLLEAAIEIPGLINAYSPRYTRDIGYSSDSRGSWRFGHPLEHPAVARNRAMQLLTHPMWWVDASGSPQATVERILNRRYEFLDAEAGANCQSYRARQRDTDSSI
jgi:hypothetical protein